MSAYRCCGEYESHAKDCYAEELTAQLAESRESFRVLNLKAMEREVEWKAKMVEKDAEIATLKEALAAFEAMREALEYILDVSPHDGSESACLWCDMGGAGYSSGGENHHDDIRRVCPVVKASQALAELDPSSAAEVGGGE